MPSVTVVLKNGTLVEVAGANDAEWQGAQITDRAPQLSLFLVVMLKEPNKVETRGRFRGEDVAGYTIDVR